MARTNESNINLPSLFANTAFRIPHYQRGYAWGEKQWSELWEDIWDIEKDGNGEYRRHYTGTIALQEIPKENIPLEERWLKEKGTYFFDVVDGQQRLTTIVILLYELIRAYDDEYPETQEELQAKYLFGKKKNSETKVYLFAYKKEDKNSQFLLNKIYEDSTVILPIDYFNVYTNNLQNAQKYFRDKISELNKEERIELLSKMQNALAFDTKYIDNELSVQAVFETMNNRGKQLTILEKLKNRLLFLAAKLDVDDGDIEILTSKINDAWRIIYNYLGKNPKGIMNEDEFLSAHLSLIRKPSDYTFSESVAEKKVFEMFCNRAQNYLLDYTRGQGEDAKHEPIVSYEKIQSYILDISQFVPFWYEVVNSNDIRIQKILYLNASKEMKLLIAELLRNKEISECAVNECIDLVYKVVFRDNIPGLGILDERTFANRAREIHSRELSIAEFVKELETKLSIPCNNESVINRFKDLFTYIRGNVGFHRWWGLKFFLMEYEEYLRRERYKDELPHVQWNNYDEINIEHIMPQEFKTNWQQEMDDYLEPRQLDEERRGMASKILVNTLGNLTILKDSKNSSLQNDGWRKKKQRYASGSFNELEISKYEAWNQYSIYERGCNMLHFMEKMVFGLKFSNQEILEMLFMKEDYYVMES